MAQPGEGGKRSGRVFYLDGCSGENRRACLGRAFLSKFSTPTISKLFSHTASFSPDFPFSSLFHRCGKMDGSRDDCWLYYLEKGLFPPLYSGSDLVGDGKEWGITHCKSPVRKRGEGEEEKSRAHPVNVFSLPTFPAWPLLLLFFVSHNLIFTCRHFQFTPAFLPFPQRAPPPLSYLRTTLRRWTRESLEMKNHHQFFSGRNRASSLPQRRGV